MFRVGYKEPEVTVDTKREVPQQEKNKNEDERLRVDELPMVVVLKGGDISDGEYRQYLEQQRQQREGMNE